MTKVRVAIVDDAMFIREGIKRLLADHPQLTVVGAAATGEELLEHLDAWAPDVVTLDLNMPGLGGLGTLDRLMATRAVPVIILSTHSGAGAPMTIEALSRGAVDFIDKEAYSLVDFGALRAALVERILSVTGAGAAVPAVAQTQPAQASPARRYGLLVIGASTGGPHAIEVVLRGLGSQLGTPVVIAQHMPAGFTKAFADRLDRTLPIRVHEAVNGVELSPGEVFIAPGGRHLALERDADTWRAVLRDHDPDAVAMPSVDMLFSTAAAASGSRTVAVLLTGMGRDGAQGMSELRRAGAHTIVQDEPTSVVWGMPRAAVEAGASREVLALEAIAGRVSALLAAR